MADDRVTGMHEPLAAIANAMTSPDPQALDDALVALSQDDWSQLRSLIGPSATRSIQQDRSRAVAAKRGRVVLLPGIMGTDLAVLQDDGVPSLVWLSVKALALGGLSKLAIPVDGTEPLCQIQSGGLMKLFYLPMHVRLGVHWHAQLFPYDWRLDIDCLADELAETIALSPGQPTHLVAHSMGGLVARAMMRRHPKVWTDMQVPGKNGPEGGRLVMLGTPNRGSFAPMLAFAGKDIKLRALALLDHHLSIDEVTRVVATFPGLYEMLPSARACPDGAVASLYQAPSWPRGAVHQALLDRAAEFQESIEESIDANRMVCVAGSGHLTVDGVELRRGKLRWHRSGAGDGTVPHALGLLPSVVTYWSTAKHGSLPKDPGVLRAIDDLLISGTTFHLPSGTEPSARGDDEGAWIDDDDLATDAEVQTVVSRVRTRDFDLIADLVPVPDDQERTPTVAMRIEVIWGDIGRASADVVAVGHYEDLYPTAAEAALDRALSGEAVAQERILHGATARHVLRGELGEVSFFPWLPAVGDSITAAVVGLGRPGTFGLAGHEVLVRNLVWAAEHTAKARCLSMVLIGSGAGNLSIAQAVQSLVSALDTAAREGELTGRLAAISIVENELGRARRIGQTLNELVARRDGSTTVNIELGPLIEGEDGIVSDQTALRLLLSSVAWDKDSVADRVGRLPESDTVRSAVISRLTNLVSSDLANFEVLRRQESATEEAPTRLSILVRDGELYVSAISDAATVSERRLGLELELFETLVALANTEGAGDLDRAGALLMRLAVPREFMPFLQRTRPMILEVDRSTAALPWEILNPTPGTSRGHLALRAPMARQLRTTLSPPPTVAGRLTLRRVLVIGDPGTPDGGGGLPGARAEAEAVASLLVDNGITVDLLLGADGPARATLATVLHQLLHVEYDVVHYAGHGTFSTGDAAAGTGWLFTDGLLKASHLTMIERLPPLLVANACHSGRISTGLPGLADEFMGRGVRNLVGTARAVSDHSALIFGETFYGTLLSPGAGSGEDGSAYRAGSAVGKAVLAARSELATKSLLDWDAYQLYGDPDFRFWPPAPGQDQRRRPS